MLAQAPLSLFEFCLVIPYQPAIPEKMKKKKSNGKGRCFHVGNPALQSGGGGRSQESEHLRVSFSPFP